MSIRLRTAGDVLRPSFKVSAFASAPLLYPHAQRLPTLSALRWRRGARGAGRRLGTFGAHGLRSLSTMPRSPGGRPRCSTRCGHAIGLVALGAARLPRSLLPAAMLAAGTVIFAGTLYAIALGGPRWLGAVTPVGGSLMTLGWLMLAWRVLRGAPADCEAGGARGRLPSNRSAASCRSNGPRGGDRAERGPLDPHGDDGRGGRSGGPGSGRTHPARCKP